MFKGKRLLLGGSAIFVLCVAGYASTFLGDMGAYDVVAVDGSTRVLVRRRPFTLNDIVIGPKIRAYEVADGKLFVARTPVIFEHQPNGFGTMREAGECEYYEINTKTDKVIQVSKESTKLRCNG